MQYIYVLDNLPSLYIRTVYRSIMQKKQGHTKAPDREGLSIDWNTLIGDPSLDEELYQRSMESIEQV